MENDPDVVAMIGASAALTISGLPFLGPIGAARVGYKDGEYILNPATESVKESDLDLVVAGTRDGVMMVESEASELSEEIMLGAVKFGHEQFQPVLDLIISLAEDAAKEPRDIAELPEGYDALVEKVAALGTDGLTKAYSHVVKQERSAAVSDAKAAIAEKLAEEEVADALKGKVSSIIKDLEKDIVRGAYRWPYRC